MIKRIRKGDVVVIHSTDGVEDRYGWVGIVLGQAYIILDGRYDLLVKEPTEQGYLATYHQDNLEVIDHIEGEPQIPKLPTAVIKEFKRVCRVIN